jgi:hypothetical protein
MPRRLPYSWVAVTLGSLLLVAAGLKLCGLRVSAVPHVGLLYAPWAQLAVLEWEVVLGLWLLWRRQPLASWLAALGTFTVFAGVSGYLGWIGLASCGCFGSLQASPWHACAVDVLALLALAWGRPDVGSLGQTPRQALTQAGGVLLLFCGGAALVLGLLAGAGALVFGSADAALARIRGERVSVRPGMVDLGRGAPGQAVEATVELINRTASPVRIVGGTSDCSCVTTNDLPVTLPPGEGRPVTVRVRLPRAAGVFNRQAFFWTDDERARTIVFPLTGRIEPSVQESVAVSGE